MRLLIGLFALILVPSFALAQVGKSLGLVDLNTASEKEIAALPNSNTAVATAIVTARPFASIVDVNKLLLEHEMTQEDASAMYAKAFVHINLNTATREEIVLIPGAGRKMAHEFDEYRPWKSWKQFEKEIGKYVGKDEVARLAQYCFIPLNLNTASEEDFMTIPGVGKKMAHELQEYRPWKSKEQFEKEIGKYVDAKEVARLWRFVVIE